MSLPHTSAVVKRMATPFTWLVLFASFLYFVPSVMMSHIWLELKSVDVVHADNGLNMIVDRTIHRDFRGSFRVTVRTKEGDIVCYGAPEEPFQYHKNAVLPQPLLLSWWLGSKKELEDCVAAGMGSGDYYLDTCQSVRFTELNIVLARRCVRSNVFTVYRTEELI